jgi:hypothetical protein
MSDGKDARAHTRALWSGCAGRRCGAAAGRPLGDGGARTDARRQLVVRLADKARLQHGGPETAGQRRRSGGAAAARRLLGYLLWVSSHSLPIPLDRFFPLTHSRRDDIVAKMLRHFSHLEQK